MTAIVHWKSRIRELELNPVLLKELRQTVRSRFLFWALLLYLLANLILAGVVIIQTDRASGAVSGSVPGQIVMGFLVFFLFLVNIMVGGHAFQRLAAEHSKTEIDLYFLSPLTPGCIVRGKLFAAAFVLAELYCITLPFFAFAYLLRGVDVGTLLGAAAGLFGGGILIVAGMLLLGTIPMKKQARTGMLALGTFMMIWGVPVFGFSWAFAHTRSGGSATPVNVLAAVSTGVICWATALGLLYALMVTSLSPPFSNRFLPTRVAAAVAWLVWTLLALAWFAAKHSGNGLLLWQHGSLVLALLVLALAIVEPETWGLRVRRSIPRGRYRRLFVLPFFSGQANALVWALVILALTVIVSSVVLVRSTVIWSSGTTGAVGASMVFGYGFCHVLATLWIRRNYLADRPIKIAWGILGLLVTCGTLLPPIIGYALRHLGADIGDLVAGSITTCYDEDNQWQHVQFLSVYVIVVAILNFRWFLDRLRDFAPSLAGDAGEALTVSADSAPPESPTAE